MMQHLAGPLLAALLVPVATAAAADTLEVLDARGAAVIRLLVAAGDEWCLRWNHSVTGGAVADCFRLDGGRMILARSYLHDFAAGLGEVPGRGVIRAARGGGYWIDGIDEEIAGGTLRLRVGGAAVDHRLTGPGWAVRLSPLFAGQRAILRAAADGTDLRGAGQ